ncbi:hypothetical protein [Oribacterium sp. WCC10]|uniref:hypothetical protein n=1 Tax=Oribacterium sp. WCC10 TaxID=1855343 RepID=UPI0008DEB319|nr:hypothetical protein [Oribacterium sp. WCC10]SFG34376.1 hypothetical protein SAMN05216356_10662 [Oribacterium sp. WCC10]
MNSLNSSFFQLVLMTKNQSAVTAFFAQHGIQIVLGVMIIYYAVKLLVFKDVDAIRPKEWGKLKEENIEPYSKEMGILVLCFAACVLAMEIVSQYDGLMGLLFICLSIGVVFYRFKKIEEKYGNKNHG